jgi:hypothetical protein
MTTTADRCDCCDLPAYSCGKAVEQCQRAEQANERVRLRAQGWTPAQWPGRCDACNEPFDAGSLISHLGVEHGWRAECCA